MADGLKMMLAMAVFFGLMYLYALSPEIIAKWKAKKLHKSKLQKEENRKVEKLELQKKRDQVAQSIDDRREKIKEHYKWLEDINAKIKSRANAQEENII
jgi:hypothetical protein